MVVDTPAEAHKQVRLLSVSQAVLQAAAQTARSAAAVALPLEAVRRSSRSTLRRVTQACRTFGISPRPRVSPPMYYAS